MVKCAHERIGYNRASMSRIGFSQDPSSPPIPNPADSSITRKLETGEPTASNHKLEAGEPTASNPVMFSVL